MDLDIWLITWPGGVEVLGPRFLLDIRHLVCPLHSGFHTARGSIGTCRSILQWSLCCVHLHGHVLVLGLLQPIPCGSLHLGVSSTGSCAEVPLLKPPLPGPRGKPLEGRKEAEEGPLPFRPWLAGGIEGPPPPDGVQRPNCRGWPGFLLAACRRRSHRTGSRSSKACEEEEAHLRFSLMNQELV
jgi:hypothetical protein